MVTAAAHAARPARMRPRAPLSFFSVVAAASMALAFGALMAACAKQGEAERCDSKKNGNDDCQDGLTCQDRGLNSTICCPPTGPGTTPECRGELRAPTDSAPRETNDSAVETAVIPDGGYGFPCVFDSQCADQFRCRLGKCSYECAGDRDCRIELPTLPFCDTCGDHQCHATDKPEFRGTKDPDSGVCAPPDAGTDATTSDAVGDTTTDDAAATDSSTADSTVTDSAAADGG